MRIVLSPRAEKELKKLHKLDQIALVKKIGQLTGKTMITGVKKLSGYQDIFRLRMAKHRVVYRQEAKRYYVVTIAHRKEIYQKLKRLLG